MSDASEDRRVKNRPTKWNGRPFFSLPTIFDPVLGIYILPEGVETVDVAMMQVENGIESYKYFIDNTYHEKVMFRLPAYSFVDCREVA